MQRTGESGFEVLRNYRARLPLTKTFALIGALLTVFGALNRSGSLSLDININLIWGVILLAFGVLMLAGAVRGGKKPPTA